MVTKMRELETTFSGIDFSGYKSRVSEFVNELSIRALCRRNEENN